MIFQPVSRFPSRRALLMGMVGLAATPLAARAQIRPTSFDVRNYRGLHLAAHNGDAGEIRRLIAARANPNARDGQGRTPLHVATFAARHEAMRALKAGGADPRLLENQLYDCITIAAVADDVATMKLAIEIGGDPKAITSPYNGTALIAAAHLGHDEVVATLIEAGAPLDHVNNLGWTALIEAVILGDGGKRHQETARHLVKAGARRDLADKQGLTPLDHARQRRYEAMVEILSA